MRKVKYPADIMKFKLDFLNYMPDISNKNDEWRDLWDSEPLIQTYFPRSLNSILIADYATLVGYYNDYTNNVASHLTDDQKSTLNPIFNYDACQSRIAEFFMNHATEMELYVCHYCEAAYINAYPLDDKVGLKLLNNASRDKLRYLLGGSYTSADKVINNRNFDTKKEFNDFWKKNIPNGGENKFEQIWNKRNHFDIDHALDKGNCPIVALSVMNFVPSCQVCNEKLKRSKLLGDYINRIPIERLSPTSPNYDFYSNVKIKLVNQQTTTFDPAYAVANHQHYDIEFECLDKDYENIVEIFKLEERYKFHKIEGLYWLQMKRKYPDSNIEMMSEALAKPEYSSSRIKEDIFRIDYDRLRHPCFYKLKQDSLI